MRRSQDIEEKGGNDSEPLLLSNTSKGGLITLPFILAIDGVEKAVSFGLQPNMIIYLMGSYGLDMPTASNILFSWTAATNFAPVVGAFLADTSVGRFRMIGFGSIFSVMGMTLLWLTTMIPGARPSCDNMIIGTKACSSTPLQLIFLCSSFGLMTIGSGGIRSSTAAFGADQVVRNGCQENTTPMNKENNGALGSFFNWYFFSGYVAIMFALTFLVYIQDNMGWKVGYGVPPLLTFLAAIIFFSASSLYVKAKPKSSLLTGLAQVFVASWANRHFELPSQESLEMLYHVAQGSTLKAPSGRLRFLNKACIIKNPGQDLTLEGTPVDPWRLCTTNQVEELKSIFNVIPIWSTGILLAMLPGQTSFQVLQANTMDRHFLSPSFEIPAGSYGTFAFIIALIWVALYDRVIIPLASKIKGKPTTISIRTRLGISYLLCIVAMVVAAIVERVRLARANGEILQNNNPEPMSAMWLVPQICLLGLAEAFGGVALIELFYSDLPKTMSSIAGSLYGVGMTVASLIGSLIMSLTDYITKRGGRQSWISGDVNKGHYDYYCWVLAGLSVLNYLYFLLCSKAYWEGKRDFNGMKENNDEPLAPKL